MADLRRAALGALAGALLAGATGCGGGGSSGPSQAERFKQGYQAQRAPLNAMSERIGKVLTDAGTMPDAELLVALRRLERDVDARLTRLEALDPPPALTARFAKVTRAGRGLDADLKAIADAVAAHDANAAGTRTAALVASLPQIQAATSALVKALGLPAQPTSGRTATAAAGTISVAYDEPSGAGESTARDILRLGGTDGVAAGLSKTFVLPTDLRIHVVRGDVGPNYESATHTITLSYGFVQYIAATLRKNLPELRKDENELGRELAAIDGFILMHELGHALIDVYGLPVLGKEEDAADSVAAVFFTTSVANGAEYAFDTARFFHLLSARQRRLAPSDYWDEHSLDEQRASSIVCWIAGASEDSYKAVQERRLLGADRLQRCPAEYRQKVAAWQSLLSPHVRPS